MEQQLPLRDIHLPESVGWWPPAIGWWLLLILVPLLIVGLVWVIRRLRRVSPVKLARRELDALRADASLDPAEKLRRLSILLRRTALSIHPRDEVASLTGEAWLRWLDSGLGEPRFSRGVGRWLVDVPYRPTPPTDLDELLDLCRDWLNAVSRHRRNRRAVSPPGREVSEA
ncbi:DUF4381 domain-containing protein [Methylomagnum sp.]